MRRDSTWNWARNTIPFAKRSGNIAAEVDPDLIARLKAFYSAKKGNQTDESQLAKYISLAVNLSDPPALKPQTA